jgi:hypothetical protein
VVKALAAGAKAPALTAVKALGVRNDMTYMWFDMNIIEIE